MANVSTTFDGGLRGDSAGSGRASQLVRVRLEVCTGDKRSKRSHEVGKLVESATSSRPDAHAGPSIEGPAWQKSGSRQLLVIVMVMVMLVGLQE